jgi:hypothetical protein
MDKLTFAVKGQSEPYYLVKFKNKDGTISLKCGCRAGTLTKLCRHKVALVRGDISALYVGDLYEEDQTESFQIMQQWIASSGLAALIQEHDHAEREFQQKDRQFKRIKFVIQEAMLKGA